MTKILIATDFSSASEYAYRYAEWLALQLDAFLIVVHIAEGAGFDESIADQKIQLGNRLTRFATPYPHKEDPALTTLPPPKCIVRFGKITEQIEAVAQSEKADLIILGVKEKYSIWQYLFGSISTAMVRNTQFPLLIIPEGTQYQEIRKIAFATAVNLKEEKIFPQLTTIAQALNARINSFFVNTHPDGQDKFKEERIETTGGQHGSPFSSILMIRERTVMQGIEYYLEHHTSEMLTLYVPDRDYLESLLHLSVSKQAIYQVKIPILILK